MEYDKAVELRSFYVFSPIITDLVDKARLGNPIIQQWLVELLYQPKFIETIRSAWLSGDSSTKNNSIKVMDFISDIISYLFDKPDKYSFDLFMRIKASYPFTENIDEYIDNLKPFVDREYCIAGCYEYGMLLCENQKLDNGLLSLQMAANSGYVRAAEYLYKYYSSIHYNSFETAYYATLRPGLFSHSFVCNYKSHVEDDLCLTSIKILHDMIFGNLFSSDSLADLSRSFNEILEEFKNPKDNYTFGFLGGISDRFALKLPQIALSVSKTDNAILSNSLKYQENTYMFVLTDKHFYYGRNKKVSSVSFDDSLLSPKEDILNSYMIHIPAIYQIYNIAHCYFKKYSDNCSTEILEKMAMLGNPLAVCNLLNNSNISDGKKEVLKKRKTNWERRGKYYAVCPQCHKARTKEDAFCPDCGARIY